MTLPATSMLALALALALSQVELPPEATATPAPQRLAVSVPMRATLSVLAGVVGAAAGLGLSLALVGGNPLLDVKFATAAMCALLTVGGVFTVHQLLGGRGEVALAVVVGLAAFAFAALGANAIDGTVPLGPILIASLGGLPAAGLVMLSLEGTSPRERKVELLAAPTGLLVRF
jgi:hypothetical protein